MTKPRWFGVWGVGEEKVFASFITDGAPPVGYYREQRDFLKLDFK
ncbi:hypothetical protein [uncultured Nostoc sp.]